MDLLEFYFHSKVHKHIALSFLEPAMSLYFIRGDFSVIKLDGFEKSIGIYENHPHWIRDNHQDELSTLAEYYNDYSVCESKILTKDLEIQTDLNYFYVSYTNWDEIKNSINLILKSHCYYYSELIVENLHHDNTNFDIKDLRFINDENLFSKKLENIKKSIKE